MTLETAKRLYAHYKEKGMTKEAQDIANKRPQVKGTQGVSRESKKK